MNRARRAGSRKEPLNAAAPVGERPKTGRFALLQTNALTPNPRNPRKHTREQIRAIAKSIMASGFNAPILIDKDNKIVAGHGRYEAANYLGLIEVPVVCLDHLSPSQATAFMLADNALTDRSSWDDRSLATHLKELSEISLEFDLEATGFELPEIDFRVQSLEETDTADRADFWARTAKFGPRGHGVPGTGGFEPVSKGT